jgi:hypothetical protein
MSKLPPLLAASSQYCTGKVCSFETISSYRPSPSSLPVVWEKGEGEEGISSYHGFVGEVENGHIGSQGDDCMEELITSPVEPSRLHTAIGSGFEN